MVPTKTKPPPQPGHANMLKLNIQEAEERVLWRLQQNVERGNHEFLPHASKLEDNPAEIPTQMGM